MTFPIKPVKLHDCHRHGLDSDSELFIVEGDSASKAVARARDSQFQAVLPMQGKPLNSLRASRRAVDRNELYRVLRESIGAGWGDEFELESMRYAKIIMLFDPDADGIHCGALLLMYFTRWMRPALESGRVSIVQPPLYRITSPSDDGVIHAYSSEHFRQIRDVLEAKGIDFQSQCYRGLASIDAGALSRTCLDPRSRQIHELTLDDARNAIETFGGRRETGC